VYPLTVVSKNNNPKRKVAALNVLNAIQMRSPTLVEQAKQVSSELVRVAVLLPELAQEAIDEASRCWFQQHDFKGMYDKLMPVHALMDQGPSTASEQHFYDMYHKVLREAHERCKQYKETGCRKALYLNQAWDLYTAVIRALMKMPPLSEIELQEVSPFLLNARDLDLAMPGSYRAGHPVVKIASFHHRLTVIQAKTKPRKALIMGTDGYEYFFLLKGHEDIRLDERVMQLFALVNTLLRTAPISTKADLAIYRYGVIPLSPTSGLIEWVPRCDTVHSVIKKYRDLKKMNLEIEQKMMMKFSMDYNLLALIQKVVDIF
jgi:FKBP12-rapamycin complex-associated protein